MSDDITALCKRLAEFMGGVRLESNWSGWRIGERNYYDEIVGAIPEQTWNPPENIAQAMMVLTKTGKNWKLEYRGEQWREPYFCYVEASKYWEQSTTPEMAAAKAADAWLRQGGGG